MSKNYLLGIDQGTSGSRALILDRDGQVHGYAYRPLARLHPRPDRVEQDPTAVAHGVAEAITEALDTAGIHPAEIAACGITCQRNTDFAWDTHSGQALSNAITWQDLRTLPILDALRTWPHVAQARDTLGYAPGPYMSALHMAWRMQHDTAVIEAARAGRLRFGLSAAWLVTALGTPTAHVMDTSLVQAMGVYDFRRGNFWHPWLDHLQIPLETLPTAVPTLHDFGTLQICSSSGAAADVPVLAMIGDQQSALFGHGCRTPGAAECTQGTATFVKLFMGEQAPHQETIDVFYAWDLGARQTYCLEAPTTVIGAAIRWMRDDARLLDSYDELSALATAVGDSGGVVFVPAFTGLNAPYHDPAARGTILGLTLGTHRGHIVRAFLEALGFQIRAILDTIAADTAITVSELLVGGGVTASDEACQIQADLTGLPVVRPTFAETTAWAAALLAGMGADFWPTVDDLPTTPGSRTLFEPRLTDAERNGRFADWQRAVALVRAWGAEK